MIRTRTTRNEKLSHGQFKSRSMNPTGIQAFILPRKLRCFLLLVFIVCIILPHAAYVRPTELQGPAGPRGEIVYNLIQAMTISRQLDCLDLFQVCCSALLWGETALRFVTSLCKEPQAYLFKDLAYGAPCSRNIGPGPQLRKSNEAIGLWG